MHADPGTGLRFRRGRDAVKHRFHSLLGRLRH